MAKRRKAVTFVTSMEELTQLHGDTVVKANVGIDNVLPRRGCLIFHAQVPVSLVRANLLHSIFDWPFVNQLMVATIPNGSLMLQKKINDLEKLYKLTSTMQCISLQHKPGFKMEHIITNPTYDVAVKPNGQVVVKKVPNLLIKISAPGNADEEIADDEGGVSTSNQLLPEKAAADLNDSLDDYKVFQSMTQVNEVYKRTEQRLQMQQQSTPVHNKPITEIPVKDYSAFGAKPKKLHMQPNVLIDDFSIAENESGLTNMDAKKNKNTNELAIEEHSPKIDKPKEPKEDLKTIDIIINPVVAISNDVATATEVVELNDVQLPQVAAELEVSEPNIETRSFWDRLYKALRLC